MKTKYFLLSAVAVIVALQFSCNKDANDIAPSIIDTTDTTHTNPLTTNGPMLKNVYYIDTTLPGLYDTLYRYTFTYDASNRLNLLTRLETDPTTGDSVQYYATSYSYNGSDTFASRTIQDKRSFYSTAPFFTVYHDTTYFSFVNGEHSFDSTLQSGYRAEVHRYSHNANMLYITGDTYQPYLQHTTRESSNVLQTFTNNDIAYQLDTFTHQSVSIATNYLYDRFEWSFAHISNPNPMYRIALPTLNAYYHDEEYIYGGIYEPQHLLSSITEHSKTWNQDGTTTAFHDVQGNFTYEFRSDGYPTIGRWTGTVEDIGYPLTIFFYKMVYVYQ